MATNYNYFGGIVTNGLVLDLDAAKLASYPGTGTSWYDISGNNNNGTLTNGPTFSGIGKQASIVFDGTDDYATFPTSSLVAFGTGSYTVNTWFNLNSNSKYAGNCSFFLSMGGSNTLGGVLCCNRFNSNALLYYASGIILQPSVTLNVNTWYYLNLVFTGGTAVSMYLNGNLLQSTSFNYNFTFQNWVIGANQDYYPENMDGKISNMSFYNRALSQAEITQNFNALRGRYGI